MFLPASLYVEGSALLNQNMVYVPGGEVSFYVHYWGGISEHFDNPIHKHSFFEICYVVEGQGTYYEEDCEHPLSAGTLFCSRPQIRHQIRSSTGLGLVFVAFEIVAKESTESSNELFDDLSRTTNICIQTTDNLPTVLIWKALLLESAKPHPLYRDRVQSLSIALLASFPPTFAGSQQHPRTGHPQQINGTAVYQAKLFIRDNLSTPLRLSDVAKQLHISDRQLSRVFQGELGQTFTEYVRQQRIQRAVLLLSESTLSIKQIAEQAGYSNVFYFTRVFTLEMQISPAQFRRKLADV